MGLAPRCKPRFGVVSTSRISMGGRLEMADRWCVGMGSASEASEGAGMARMGGERGGNAYVG